MKTSLFLKIHFTSKIFGSFILIWRVVMPWGLTARRRAGCNWHDQPGKKQCWVWNKWNQRVWNAGNCIESVVSCVVGCCRGIAIAVDARSARDVGATAVVDVATRIAVIVKIAVMMMVMIMMVMVRETVMRWWDTRSWRWWALWPQTRHFAPVTWDPISIAAHQATILMVAKVEQSIRVEMKIYYSFHSRNAPTAAAINDDVGDVVLLVVCTCSSFRTNREIQWLLLNFTIKYNHQNYRFSRNKVSPKPRPLSFMTVWNDVNFLITEFLFCKCQLFHINQPFTLIPRFKVVGWAHYALTLIFGKCWASICTNATKVFNSPTSL